MYSILDCDWGELQHAYEEWLTPANFAPAGGQMSRLSQVRLMFAHLEFVSNTSVSLSASKSLTAQGAVAYYTSRTCGSCNTRLRLN